MRACLQFSVLFLRILAHLLRAVQLRKHLCCQHRDIEWELRRIGMGRLA